MCGIVASIVALYNDNLTIVAQRLKRYLYALFIKYYLVQRLQRSVVIVYLKKSSFGLSLTLEFSGIYEI